MKQYKYDILNIFTKSITNNADYREKTISKLNELGKLGYKPNTILNSENGTITFLMMCEYEEPQRSIIND